MTWIVPDVRNTTEAAAGVALRAALVAGGVDPTTIPVYLFNGEEDEPYIGTGSGYADSRGADGTVSAQGPFGHLPGDEGGDHFSADIWGMTSDDVWARFPDDGELVTTAALWGTTPDYTLYGGASPTPPAAPPAPPAARLLFEVTTLHYPTQPAKVIGQVRQYHDGEVVIPFINDQPNPATAKVTLNVHDDILGSIFAERDEDMRLSYWTMLRAWYRGVCVFWGPIVAPDWNGAQGTVTLQAVDPTGRLAHHYLRIGDTALAELQAADGSFSASPHLDKGDIAVGTAGIRQLIDAARNTTTQTDRDVPDIGIADGEDTAPAATITMRVVRGQEVWRTVGDLLEHEEAPDVELVPVVDTDGVYCQINTYPAGGLGVDRRGDDSAGFDEGLALHFGFGADTLSDFHWTPGGTVKTHQHALSRNLKLRVTAADLDASALYGVYVGWEATDVDYSDHGAEDALRLWARQQVQAYARPQDRAQITLRPDTFAYLRDFGLGDRVRATARKGWMRTTIDGRIVTVTLRQDADTGRATAELELLPTVGESTPADED